MKKNIKFHVKDEDGNSYLVEEIQEKKDCGPEIMDDETEETPVLTESEIAVLRKLAGRAEDLLKLLDIEKEEHESAADDVEEDIEEEKEITDEDEEVIETDKEKKVTHDAKKSFGAIEKKKSTNDSFDDKELEVEAAWAKRFGGK